MRLALSEATCSRNKYRKYALSHHIQWRRVQPQMLSFPAIFGSHWQHLQMTRLCGPLCGPLWQHITSISFSSLPIHSKLLVNTQIYAYGVIISISGRNLPQELSGERCCYQDWRVAPLPVNKGCPSLHSPYIHSKSSTNLFHMSVRYSLPNFRAAHPAIPSQLQLFLYFPSLRIFRFLDLFEDMWRHGDRLEMIYQVSSEWLWT